MDVTLIKGDGIGPEIIDSAKHKDESGQNKLGRKRCWTDSI